MLKRRNSIVICIEGIDGAGKSTVVAHVAAILGDSAIIYNRCSKGKCAKLCLSYSLVKKSNTIQALIYTLIAWRNYLKLERDHEIILMDRCALSNTCYFFPHAAKSTVLTRLSVLLEPPIWPDIILVLNESADIAWRRCGKEKPLDWLATAAKCYEHFARAGKYCGLPIMGVDKPSINERVEEVLTVIEMLNDFRKQCPSIKAYTSEINQDDIQGCNK